ncbi:MAG TPA: EamA family transporter [Aggregatilineaceae bacterium]|nr:EamA family transporter [Aggregatilineaceae bacterium]
MSTLSKVKVNMNIAIVYILISVVGGAAGQVLLKKGMANMGPLTISAGQLFNIIWRMATNPYVVIGLAVYMFGTLFWLVALSRVQLSFAYPFASLSYGLMLLASWLLFAEDISLPRVIGTAVIVAGVLIISRS